MKFHLSILLLMAACLCACDNFKATKKYHTPPVTAPSVAPVKESIARASQASEETSRHISAIKAGTDTVDYKGGRALEFFPPQK